MPIVPAVIPQSEDYLKEKIRKLGFAQEIQIDLVDGQFVDASSWPYDPQGEPMAVKHVTDKFTLEVDLMVADPIKAAAVWIDAGADMLVFHMDSVSLEDFTDFADSTHVSIGVAATGDFDMEQYAAYVEVADYMQLMGVKEIGAQGQAFYEPVLEKVTALKQRFPFKEIAVDGSVNQQTVAQLKQAGVTRFVVGSAIVLQENPQAAYEEIRGLINAA